MSTQKESESTAGNLIIGKGVTISGNVNAPGEAQIDGNLEGELNAREVIVGPSGSINGKVEAKVADIRGQVRDEIRITESVVIRATAKIMGSLHYKGLQIESGAQIDGQLSRIEGDASAVITPLRAAGNTD